jgi:excinuclease UvrABC nuclease subunit
MKKDKFKFLIPKIESFKKIEDRNCKYIPRFGVYALFKKGKLLYIGQSGNIASRVFSAHKASKDFDEVKVYGCRKERMDLLEFFLILQHKPPLNISVSLRSIKIHKDDR